MWDSGTIEEPVSQPTTRSLGPGTLVFDDAQLLEVDDAGARVLGRVSAEGIAGTEWRSLLHPDATNAISAARERARQSPGTWVDLGGLQVAFPSGGWLRVTGKLRTLGDGRDEWLVERDEHIELIEGWDAIAWWLGVSERTARRWAAETVDPMPVRRAPNGRISTALPELQGWRDRRELELLRGWDSIAAHLGVSERTARRWHKQGLPVERRGGRWVGTPHALKAWRDNRRR